MAERFRRLIALTGAGISVASGLGTFEGSKKDWRAILDRDFATESLVRYAKEYEEFVAPMRTAKPNDAHIALAERDIVVITANVDRLHEKAGSTTHAIHGSVKYFDPIDDDVVLYGDSLPPAYFEATTAIEHTYKDLLIIGTSLHTNTLKELVMGYRMTSEGRIFVIDTKSEINVRKFLHEYYDEEDGDLYKYAVPYADFVRNKGSKTYNDVMDDISDGDDNFFGLNSGNFEEIK